MHQSQRNMRVCRTKITTDVQWYLDENKKLIMAILENMKHQNLDRCAEHQEKLQKNLIYLATLADWQHSRTQAMSPQQMSLPSKMQPEYSMQDPQVVAMAQQQGISTPTMPLQFTNPQQEPRQHPIQGQVALTGEWIGNGMYPMYCETAFGGGYCVGSTSTASPNDASGVCLQGPSDGGDGQGNNSTTLHKHNNFGSSD